jgi:hypothetical protein
VQSIGAADCADFCEDAANSIGYVGPGESADKYLAGA